MLLVLGPQFRSLKETGDEIRRQDENSKESQGTKLFYSPKFWMDVWSSNCCCWFKGPSFVRWKKLGMKWELRMKTVKKRRGPNYSTHLKLVLRGISPPVLDLPYYLLPWSWLVLKILRHIKACQIKILQIFCIDTQFHEMVPPIWLALSIKTIIGDEDRV